MECKPMYTRSSHVLRNQKHVTYHAAHFDLPQMKFQDNLLTSRQIKSHSFLHKDNTLWLTLRMHR